MRHKRQALQDMARPLKQWLYKHRDNPYPTKTEKILLALGSQMTLVQVREPPRAAPTAPRTGGMGNAAPPRRARVWCPLSFHLPGAAGDTSASATCVGRSWEAAVRPGGPGASSPCSPQGSPPCPQRDFPRLSLPGWGRAEDRQLNTGVFPPSLLEDACILQPHS